MTSFTSDDYPDVDRPQQHSSSNDNDKNTNGLVVALEPLSDDIKLEQIVHKFEFDGRTSNLVLCLNHRYKKKIIISPIIFKKWPQSIETFKSQVKSKGVNAKHIDQLCDIVNNNYEQISKAFLGSIAAAEEESKDQQESVAQKLLRLAEEQCQELFVDQYNEPYAAVKIRGHLETLNLNYSRFKNWICKAYYLSEGSVPNSESITNAINVLKANAEFDGKSKELHLRVTYGHGETKEEEVGTTRTTRTTIFYDLTNPDWEAVKVTPERWTLEKAPILFKRHNAQPQVYPSKEYPPDIFDRFMRLLNINEEETKVLVKCYIIASFIPEFDKPILMLHGDPGAAKSTLQELIKTLVDPSSVLTFALPRDLNELVQQLDHNHIAFYDNVSKIPYWISDQFCRASTGAGSSKRRLFTDDDDKIYNFRRCVGFNGVNLAATKSDLLDRGLIIRVERINDKLKRKKGHIWQDFDETRPQLLGYIFDIMVKVLRMRQTTSIEFEKLPRMADFAEVGEIISRCMGNNDNQFINAYYENIKLQTEEIFETNLVASAILNEFQIVIGNQ